VPTGNGTGQGGKRERLERSWKRSAAKNGGRMWPFAESRDYVQEIMGLYNLLIFMSEKTASTG